MSVAAPVFEDDRLFIGGRWVAPSSPEILEVCSPTTEAVVGRVPLATAMDVERAVSAAGEACQAGDWSALAVSERIDYLEALGAALERRQGELVQTIVAETGLPIGGTVLSGTGAGQVGGTFELIRATIDVARTFPFVEEMLGRAGRAIVRQEPVGVVGAIVPWNGPLWSAMMKIGPALLAGCPCILKPSPLAPLDSLILAQCAEEVGFPPGVLSVLPGGRAAGEALVGHAGVHQISFTGSTEVGRQIALRCAQRLARYNLELGGKSAAVILDDADFDSVVPVLLAGGLDNNGESCTALTRIVVSRRRRAEMVERLAVAFGELRVGDPFDPAVDIGPLISEQHRARVEGYVTGAVTAGARLVVGGRRPLHLDRGWFVEPVLLDDVDNTMAVARDEIFGPVLSVLEYATIDDAVDIANDSPYGLCGAVFSADVDHATAVSARIETGTVNVNRFVINIDAPLGGRKQSGIGREYGEAGFREFVEAKTINLPSP